MEQDIGFEPMTYTLATCRSSTELILQKENPGADIAHHVERPTSGGLDHIPVTYYFLNATIKNLAHQNSHSPIPIVPSKIVLADIYKCLQENALIVCR
jgi:hypothetical protein